MGIMFPNVRLVAMQARFRVASRSLKPLRVVFSGVFLENHRGSQNLRSGQKMLAWTGTLIWCLTHLKDVDSQFLIAVFDRYPETLLHEVCGSAFLTTAYRGRSGIAQNG